MKRKKERKKEREEKKSFIWFLFFSIAAVVHNDTDASILVEVKQFY